MVLLSGSSADIMSGHSVHYDRFMNQQASVSKAKVALSVALLSMWILSMVALFLLGTLLHIPGANNVIVVFHKGVVRLLNLECVVDDMPDEHRPTLYISNHISYMDIFVLGSVLRGSFIAKSDVASWPLFGPLAKLQNCLFIDRDRHKVGSQIEQIQRYLLNEGDLILFPEGTSAPGTHVAPFHSSLFQAAEHDDVEIRILPLTIAYTHYRNERMDRQTRDYYAWYKPRKIVPHFLNGLGLGRARVQLTFHEAFYMSSFESRKACAKHCEAVIRQGLLNAIDQDEEVLSASTRVDGA
jgi:1-acyl-sn-glycerol-3-phosphate acyltransferase